jgi:hypothetical protein
MSEGIYAATISITATEATNTPRIVRLSLRITELPQGQEMHVKSIDMELKLGGFWIFKYTYATATVTIVAAGDNPVEGAQISGHWTEAASDSDSGTTDLSGKVIVTSNSVWSAPEGTTFTFTVDNVTKAGWTYNSEANVRTSDSITVNSGSSGGFLSNALLVLRKFIHGKIASLFETIGCQEM